MTESVKMSDDPIHRPHSSPNTDCNTESSTLATGIHYRTVHAYAEAVREWLWWQQSNYLMYPMLHTLPHWLPPPPTTPPQPEFLPNGEIFIPGHNNNNRQVPAPPPAYPAAAPTIIRDYTIPPIWKRAVAEFIDFIIMLVVKVIISVVFLNHFGLLREESMDFNFLYQILRAEENEIDYDKLLSITTEMLAIQMVHRVCITIVEALMLQNGMHGHIGGCTPGKQLMGIRVIGCDAVISAGPGRVQVVQPRNLGFLSAFMRSLMKNFGISFFFPVVLTMFMFEHSRALYDTGAGSLVVYTPSRPRQQQMN